MKKLLLMVFLVLSLSMFANAQSAGKYGFNLAYAGGGPSIGFTYHVTDIIAVRPNLLFTSTTDKDQSLGAGKTGDLTTSKFGIGVDGLYYLSNSDGLGTYVLAGFNYNKTSKESSDGIGGTSKSDASTTGFSAGLGFQYSLNSRLSTYGEIGLGYASSDSQSTFGISNSGVGIIFYLN